MNNFEYVDAASTTSAVRLLGRRPGSRIIAGGTDIMAEMKAGVIAPERLVNLKKVKGLDNIYFNGKGDLHLGPLATLDAIASDDMIRERFPLLARAIAVSASPQLRNQGTIAGNLCQDSRCWYYRGQFNCWLKGGEVCFAREGENAHHSIFDGGPCYTVHPSDPAPALVVLEARIKLSGPEGEKMIPLERFFQQPREGSRKMIILQPEEVITGLEIPVPPVFSQGTYIKAMERKVWSFALASIAVLLIFENEEVRKAGLVAGGVAPLPWRLHQVEEFLHGKRLDESTIEEASKLAVEDAQPLSHNGYKVPLLQGLVKEALFELRTA